MAPDYNTLAHRMQYFNNEKLYAEDFIVEQNYHLDRNRRMAKGLVKHGVADGLAVVKSGDKQLTVRSGTAIDKYGQQSVQLTDIVINLTAAAAIDFYVTITYHEEDDYPDPDNAGLFRRKREAPVTAAATSAPPTDGSTVILAHFVTAASGNVPGNLNDVFTDMRQYAENVIADKSVSVPKLASDVTGRLMAGYVSFVGSLATPTLNASFNVTSVSKPATGQYQINWTSAVNGFGPFFCSTYNGYSVKILSSNGSSLKIQVQDGATVKDDSMIFVMAAA
jgi:hypothetical protein